MTRELNDDEKDLVGDAYKRFAESDAHSADEVNEASEQFRQTLHEAGIIPTQQGFRAIGDDWPAARKPR